jgi:hypothetical protein
VSCYLRSLADAGTHRGHYSIVTRSVHALRGIEFVPRPLPLGGPALPGSPLDPRAGLPAVPHRQGPGPVVMDALARW